MENIVNSTIALYKAYRKTRCGKRDNPTAMRYRMEAIERTAPKHIMEAIRMMYTATVLFLIFVYALLKCMGY